LVIASPSQEVTTALVSSPSGGRRGSRSRYVVICADRSGAIRVNVLDTSDYTLAPSLHTVDHVPVPVRHDRDQEQALAARLIVAQTGSTSTTNRLKDRR
jgi:hypothetical protein